MKRAVWLGMLALAAGMTALPVRAESQDDEGEKKFTIHGEVRARWEYVDNILDFEDSADRGGIGDPADDSFSFTPFRIRIAAKGMFAKGVTGYVELQNNGFFGDEFPQKVFDDPIGQAFDNTGFYNDDQNDTNLYQGFLELDHIGGSNFGASIGRREHALGNELQMGDSDFYGGQSFDGVRGWYGNDKWNVNGFMYKVAENNILLFTGTQADVDLRGVTFNMKFGSDQNQEIEPYLIIFHDGAEFFIDHADFITLGARYTKSNPDHNGADWNVELALQDGDVGSGPNPDSHSASLVEGWFGWSFGGKHRVHVGALMSSGDDDESDGVGGNEDTDHEDYLFLFPDNHAHNRLGDMDIVEGFLSYADTFFGSLFSNGITDYNVGYEWMGETNSFMAAYHQFTLTEPLFTGNDALGSEIDLGFNHMYNENTSLGVFVGNFMADDVILDLFGTDDDAMRIWGQARLRW